MVQSVNVTLPMSFRTSAESRRADEGHEAVPPLFLADTQRFVRPANP